jgi:hypothetical protein
VSTELDVCQSTSPLRLRKFRRQARQAELAAVHLIKGGGNEPRALRSIKRKV